MKAPREADLQKAIIQWLELHRIFAIRTNSGAIVRVEPGGRRRVYKSNSQPGCSDILAVVPPAGTCLAIEVKRPGARTAKARRLAQESFLQAVRDRGGVALIATCVEDVSKVLQAEGLL